MRITLARAAPVAAAFECNLATFGFPFAQARARGSTRTRALQDPQGIAAFVAEGTTIGEDGARFQELVRLGRFAQEEFPGPAGFPPRFGNLVCTTPTPDHAKAMTPLELARRLHDGADGLALFGLGPRGLPPALLERASHHLEITGKGISMETATALGALPAMIHAHLQHLGRRP